MGLTRKRFHIILIPHEDAAIRNIRIPYFLLTVLLIVGISTVGVMGFLVYHYLNYTIDSITLLRLKSANHAMADRLESINEELLEIKKEMKQLADFDEQMRVLTDMEQIDPDVRSVGVGGPVAETDPILASLPPESRQLVERVTMNTDELLRQARFQRRSFIEINETIAENEDEIAHTPTIAPIDFPPPGFRWISGYPGWYASAFGPRIDPFTGKKRFHDGIDISARAGTPIRAPADGKVVFLRGGNRANAALGNMLAINHGYGFETKYGHLGSFNIKYGQQVKRWDIIGYVGNTGKATGPHLHYSVYKNGKPVNPLNWCLPQVRQMAFR